MLKVKFFVFIICFYTLLFSCAYAQKINAFHFSTNKNINVKKGAVVIRRGAGGHGIRPCVAIGDLERMVESRRALLLGHVHPAGEILEALGGIRGVEVPPHTVVGAA